MSKQSDSQLVYLDTSIFAGKVMLSDIEDTKCALLIDKIRDGELDKYEFVTSKFTLVELAELISRKITEEKAKSILFDIIYNPDLPIYLINPEPVHKNWGNGEYFDIDLLIANIVNTALEYRIPGFDTIHAHTIKKLNKDVIAVSKDVHFNRFKRVKNITDVVTASEFLDKYSGVEKKVTTVKSPA